MNRTNLTTKIIGALGIVFGLLVFSAFIILDWRKLIIPVSDIFVVKYTLVIMFINGGVWSLVVGVLVFFGLFIPETEYEKARNSLLGWLLASPFFISFFTTIFTLASTVIWKIIGWAALIYLLYDVYDSAKKLKKGPGR